MRSGPRATRARGLTPRRVAQGLRGHGLTVVGRVPLLTPINPENRRYIETKREKMGHFFGSEFVAPGDVESPSAVHTSQ